MHNNLFHQLTVTWLLVDKSWRSDYLQKKEFNMLGNNDVLRNKISYIYLFFPWRELEIKGMHPRTKESM